MIKDSSNKFDFDNEKFVFVHIPKCGGTSLHKYFKEIFGSGTLTIPGAGKFTLVPEAMYEAGYMDNGLMLLPPSSLFIVAIYIWIQKKRNPDLIEA